MDKKGYRNTDKDIEITEGIVGRNGDFDYLTFLVELPIYD